MQSSESGGHGASPASLLSFIPELVDHVEHLCQKLDIQPTVPVAAAGGITDARQVGSCLCQIVPHTPLHRGCIARLPWPTAYVLMQLDFCIRLLTVCRLAVYASPQPAPVACTPSAPHSSSSQCRFNSTKQVNTQVC